MKKINLIKSFTLGTLLLTLSAVPALASTEVTVSDNGAKSENGVLVVQAQLDAVVQANDVAIDNHIMVVSNTGDNTVKGTTGGDSTVKSGKVVTNVSVENVAGSNVAVNPCGCLDQNGDLDIKVKGNGNKSENKVAVVDLSASLVLQHNKTNLKTGVGVMSNSGGNLVKNATNGNSKIKSGKVKTTVSVTNMAGSNVYGVPAL